MQDRVSGAQPLEKCALHFYGSFPILVRNYADPYVRRLRYGAFQQKIPERDRLKSHGIRP
jgi:hypothetical protein